MELKGAGESLKSVEIVDPSPCPPLSNQPPLRHSTLPLQVNWGRAMCLRAELAETDDLACQLYSSALDKFEAVLEEEPGLVAARYAAVQGRCFILLPCYDDGPIFIHSNDLKVPLCSCYGGAGR